MELKIDRVDVDDEWLVGPPKPKLLGVWPTLRDVLQVVFFNILVLHKSLQSSFWDAATQVVKLWTENGRKAGATKNIKAKISRKHTFYMNLRKSKHRSSALHQERTIDFERSLDIEFDASNEHVGTSSRVLKKNKQKPTTVQPEPIGDQEQIQQRAEPTEPILVASDMDISDEEGDNDFIEEISKYRRQKLLRDESNHSKERSLIDVIMGSRDVISMAERINLSTRKFLMFVASIARAAGEDIDKSTFSRTSLQKSRDRLRHETVEMIDESFSKRSKCPLTVHWDGKLMNNFGTDSNSSSRSDRHAVVVTGKGVEKILGVPVIESGTGWAQAKETFALLTKWDVTDDTVAMGFDTTASNSGQKKGAAILLEKLLGRNLINLACRHHVYELIVGKVFVTLFGPTTGPEISMFQRFKKVWHALDHNNYAAIDDARLLDSAVETLRNEAVKFYKHALEKSSVYCLRGDYKELIELCLIFLGESPTFKAYHFKVPGALHNARWMSKSIYCLKMYLFRSEHTVLPEIESNLKEICLFFSLVYVKYWLQTPSSCDAPINDLNFYRELCEYRIINDIVAASAIKKFSQHLWYLSGELVGVALFSSKVSITEKEKMKEALLKAGECWKTRSKKLKDSEGLEYKSLSDLIDSTSICALRTLLGDEVEFLLESNPAIWDESLNYQAMKETIMALKVVNDCAERAIALMATYNQCLAKDEKRKQDVLQIVEENRKRLKNIKKETLKSYNTI